MGADKVIENIEEEYGLNCRRIDDDETVEIIDPNGVVEDYDLSCERIDDETIEISDPVEFVVEDVSATVAEDLSKYVSVQGYQAYRGEHTGSDSAEILICDVDNV